MKIQIINGPNLNLLGVREQSIYGVESFDSYFKKLQVQFPDIQLEYFQSNHEGEIIDKLHSVGFSYDGIIINPGAYTHTSLAIADAIAAIKTPCIEIHISNIYAREEIRKTSLISKKCNGVISGFGVNGYSLAVKSFVN